MNSRTRLIRQALEEAIVRQGVAEITSLDLTALARDIDRALAGASAPAGHSPLDPEGDGLTTPELNSANDV